MKTEPNHQGPETWSVVVLYDGLARRQQATRVCDGLVQRFWTDLEFEFHWWRTDFLEEPGMAKTALRDAIGADIFVFSAAAEINFSPAFKDWAGHVLAGREFRPGLFVDLSEAPLSKPETGLTAQTWLRELAASGGLDYLNSALLPKPPPQEPAPLAPARRGRNPPRLKIPPPSHFGLNE